MIRTWSVGVVLFFCLLYSSAFILHASPERFPLTRMKKTEILAKFYPSPPPQTDFDHPNWRIAPRLSIDLTWRGEAAPPELATTVLVLWTRSEVIFGFECAYTELDMDEEFDPNQERHGLWDRDVCEAFIRSPLEPNDQNYKEFEVAPTGQWCDLKIDRRQSTHDWQWQSGMRTAAEIDRAKKSWRVMMAIPFAAFGRRPQTGEVWKANLFRISKHHGERQYLALSPTATESPNFHVPENFIDLRFVE